MERMLCAVVSCLMALGLSIEAASAGPVAAADVKITDGEVTASLTGAPGSPVKGAEWFKNRKLGNCLACHANPKMTDEQFHGEVGPSLEGVADRWNEAQLRAIVVNSKAVFGPETLMPGFYRTTGYTRPIDKFAGKSILTAEQVEDIVAYLQTLK